MINPAVENAGVSEAGMERPSLLTPRFDSIPAELITIPRWVVWNAVWQEDKGKYSKIPYNASRPREKASSTDPATWSDFQTARRAYECNKQFAGIGIVLSDEDLLCGVDLDHAIDEDKTLIANAARIVDALGTYCEVSPSGTGVRLFAFAKLPSGGRKKGDIEVYESGRFLTVTGRRFGTQTAVEPRQAEVEAFHKSVFPSPSPKQEHTGIGATGLADASDTDLLAKATSSANGSKIAALYSGDISGYPGHSEADLALCSLLAFWTGNDPARLDRLFRSSGLMRDKWDERHYADGSTYGEKTIENVLSSCREFYNPERRQNAQEAGNTWNTSQYVASSGEDKPGDTLPAPVWPDPLHAAAYHGLAGDITRAIEPHTEGDPVAILTSILVSFGNIISQPFYPVEATHHHTNLFIAHVGSSSVGRKGTAWNNVRSLLQSAAEEWAKNRIQSGLSSGEGFVYAVRDGRDEGDDDRRLLVLEPELASVLRIQERDGNTLSAHLRNSWDKITLQVLTKNNALKATDAHVSLIGHITRDELLRYLTRTESANGFANRFLWFCVRRSKLLPDGGNFNQVARAPLVLRLGKAIAFAQQVGEVKRDDAARELWHRVYPRLTAETPGLLGAVISRAAPQVLRLSLIYALLDCSNVIRVEHLRAALAVWQYSEASARYIFGDATGDPTADSILSALKSAPDGLSMTELHKKMGKNMKADRLRDTLKMLQQSGIARVEKRDAIGEKGRDSEVWHHIPSSYEYEFNEFNEVIDSHHSTEAFSSLNSLNSYFPNARKDEETIRPSTDETGLEGEV